MSLSGHARETEVRKLDRGLASWTRTARYHQLARMWEITEAPLPPMF